MVLKANQRSFQNFRDQTKQTQPQSSGLFDFTNFEFESPFMKDFNAAMAELQQVFPQTQGTFNVIAPDGTSQPNAAVSNALSNVGAATAFNQLAPQNAEFNMTGVGTGLNTGTSAADINLDNILDFSSGDFLKGTEFEAPQLGGVGDDVLNLDDGGGGSKPPGFLESFFLGSFDEKTRTRSDPIFKPTAQAIGALGQTYAAIEGLGISEKALDFTIKSTVANFEQQKNASATQIRDVAFAAAKLDNRTDAEATQIADQAVKRSGVEDVQLKA